jgi:hypothetical protein
MTTTRKILLGFSCGLILLFAAEEFLRRFVGGFAGSYPFVEYWDLPIREDELIEIIKELKTEDSRLQPPNQIKLTHGRDSGYINESMWMEIYREELKKDSTAKPPIHSEHNSYGNLSNGWVDYWYFIDLYYSDTNEIVHIWTRPTKDDLNTTLAFISLSYVNDSTDFRLINRDFWYLANKKQIKKFEEIILDRIQKKIKGKKLKQ